ncbi:MAG: FkbM family methyltransferase [Patescibacteria group bacterium]|nr:FkbM family methyltransferase [Patescibacteria group bacterium]
MILDLQTKGVSGILFVCGTREILDTWVMQQEIEDNMHVLDIGGNIGYYVLLEASLLGEQGKVYVFEPDPRNIEILNKNIELNNISLKVGVYPYAAAKENGVQTFHLGKSSNLSTFVERKGILDSIEVKCKKLDDFEHIQKVGYIRMDIEGYESMVIDGMDEFLKTEKPMKLQIEVHPSVYKKEGFNFQERLRKLGEMGFYVKYLISAGVAEPEQITKKGYNPIRTVQEGRWDHGLYKDIKMGDLIEFLNNEAKIVRSILLVRGNKIGIR